MKAHAYNRTYCVAVRLGCQLEKMRKSNRLLAIFAELTARVCECEHCVIMMTFIENGRKVVCGQIKVITCLFTCMCIVQCAYAWQNEEKTNIYFSLSHVTPFFLFDFQPAKQQKNTVKNV